MNLLSISTLTTAFDYVSRASLLGTVAIVLVLLIRWAVGKRLAPAARSWLWLPVVLLCFSPQLPGLVDWGVSAESLPMPVSSEAETTVVVRGEPQPLLGVPEPESALPVARLSLKEKFAMGWGAGSLAIFSFWLVAYANLWLRIRRGREKVIEGLAAEFQGCARIAGIRRAPRLVVSSAVESPAVAGLWRPVVLMPQQLANSLGEEALRHVLLHELAHLRRKDLWLHWVSAVVVALHWFNPFVWLASRKFRGDRESACDATVIDMGENQAHAYGRTLLTLESRVTQTVALRMMAGILGGADLVRQRIEDITRLGKTSRRAAWLAFFAALSGTAVIALAAAEPATPRVTPPIAKDAAPTAASNELYTRTYRVTPDFLTWTQAPEERGTQTAGKEKAAKTTALEVLKNLGVHFPEGASATFVPSTSMLIVRNTPSNHGFIGAIVDARLNIPMRQIHVRSYLVVFKEGASLPSMIGAPVLTPVKPGSSDEPPKGEAGPLIVQHPVTPPDPPMAICGVFTEVQFQMSLRYLMGKSTSVAKFPADGVTAIFGDLSAQVEAVIGLPSITTRSEHRATLEVAREFIYPTEYDRKEPVKQGASAHYVPKKFEMRPIGFRMEIDPFIAFDGRTLDLDLAPELQGFTGWVDAPVADGGKVKSPTFNSNTVHTSVSIWDGQTIAFGGQANVAAFLMNPSLQGEQALISKMYPVMIFVTATMIDPSGNPVEKEASAEKKSGASAKSTVPVKEAVSGAPGGAAVSRALVQFGVKMSQPNAADEKMTEAFIGTQVEILKSDVLRKRAEERMKTYHVDLSPVAVTLTVTRLSTASQVKVEAAGSSEPYVRHFLNCLLDEMLALRKETVEKSVEGALGKVIEKVLTLQKTVPLVASQYKNAKDNGASKEVTDKLKSELDRLTEEQQIWKAQLEGVGAASLSALKGYEIGILERPSSTD